MTIGKYVFVFGSQIIQCPSQQTWLCAAKTLKFIAYDSLESELRCRLQGAIVCTCRVLRARLQWSLGIQHGRVRPETSWIHHAFDFDLVIAGVRNLLLLSKSPWPHFFNNSIWSHELQFKKVGSPLSLPHSEMCSSCFPSVFGWRITRWGVCGGMCGGAQTFPSLAMRQSSCLGSPVVLHCQLSGALPLLYQNSVVWGFKEGMVLEVCQQSCWTLNLQAPWCSDFYEFKDSWNKTVSVCFS